MKGRLALFLYSLLLRLATPVYLARLWWRGRREPLYRTKWGERLGLGLQRTEPGALWVHAVSLGETRAAVALVDLLRERRPQWRLLLTHTTATGREAGTALLREGDLQAWLPYDTPGAVRRFLAAHRPAVGVLMETEIWPNLLHEASRAGVPMVLANARLSARSQRKGERFSALLHPAAAQLRSVMAQTEGDAQRLRASGAAHVQVMGNLKFDMVMDAALIERGQAWRGIADRPTVLMASSREGEEAPLLAAWAALPGTRPLLLLVPRHPQRFDEVAALVAAAGLRCERRSGWGDLPPHHAAPADVWLGDSMREMALYYAAADVALLGGSFEPLGGQNLIEAAACGCPLLMGPHTFNFELAAELAIEAGAAQRVPDLQQAVPRAADMAADAAERSAWSARARAFAAAHRGAAARMADEVLRVAGTALR
jgi:3-deoxy-D-manno-octulosonic-acid transferase